jgi:hypothetical protein
MFALTLRKARLQLFEGFRQCGPKMLAPRQNEAAREAVEANEDVPECVPILAVE